MVRRKGYIDSILGRRRHLPDALDSSEVEIFVRREAIRQAINSPIQGTASDLNLFIAALIGPTRLKWDFKVPKDTQFRGAVHDSLLLKVHKRHMREVAKGIHYTVENLPLKKYFGVTLKVPLKVDVTASDCWEGKNVLD